MSEEVTTASTGHWRVVGLAALGYAYIAAILAIILGGIAACIYGAVTGHALLIKIAIPLAILVFTVIRAFAVRIDPPPGIPISRDEGAALWELVDRARQQVGSPRIKQILASDDVNASITQVPRFGPFGPSQSYLVAGLPLMQALTPKEFEAVIGHELGHLSRKHGRFGAWVYRTRARWDQLIEQTAARESVLLYVFLPFFRWLVPRFDQASLATARAHEFEADREAAALAGPEAAADALIAVAAAANAAGAHWESVWSRTAETTMPDRDAALRLRGAMRGSREDGRYERWVRAALADETVPYDTHPSLGERLASLGQSAEAVERRRRAPDPTAAHELLGALEDRLETQFADAWVNGARSHWQAENARIVMGRRRMAELETAAPGQLRLPELIELARLTQEFDPASAPRLWKQVLAINPHEPEAVFRMGEDQLSAGDEAGLAALARAVELDPEAQVAAFLLGAAYLAEHDRHDEIDGWGERLGIDMG